MYVREIVLGEQRRYMQQDLRTAIRRSVQHRLAPRFQRRYSAVQHVVVETETNFLDLTALFLAENFAGAADFHIVRRKCETHAEILERFDRLEALHGIRTHRLAMRHDQVGICTMVRSANPSAQLVQLCESELVGTIDDDRIGVRNVDSRFDDRGTYEDIAASMVEIEHDVFEILLAHLSVSEFDSGLRHEPGDFLRRLRNSVDIVVHEINLPAATDLTQQSFRDEGIGPLPQKRLDREPFRRRCCDNRQFARS